MPWFVLAIASVLFFSVASLLQKVLMKDDKSDPHAYSIFFQILGAVLIGSFALWRGFIMPPIGQYPFNFLLSAILYGSGTLFLFKALKYIEASEATIITSVRAIVTIVSAVLILGEVFDYKKGIGTVLILISAYVVTQKSRGIKFNKGVVYALGMSLCYGLAITNDAFIVKHVRDIFSFLTIGFLLPGIFLTIVKPTALGRLGQFLKPNVIAKMFIFTSFYLGGAVTFYFALQNGANASQITPIAQSTVIVTVILAAIFLGERDNLVKKSISAILVTIGVLLIK
jgi:drug/metabolite transporter (DMT)-like permease